MSETGDRKNRRVVSGTVTSTKMDKTITVKVQRMVQHPRFKKYVRRTTIYKAHDEEREARLGDTVEIVETRPLSKTKCHRLVRIISRAKTAEATGEATAAATAED
jgi:small subunit ribosomal protein S17